MRLHDDETDQTACDLTEAGEAKREKKPELLRDTDAVVNAFEGSGNNHRKGPYRSVVSEVKVLVSSEPIRCSFPG